MRSEEQNDRWERENASVLDFALTTKPDFVYKAVPAPRVELNLNETLHRFNEEASAVMDIPLQMIESSGRLATNMQGIMRFVNERIKEWLAFFEMITKKAFMLSYGKVIEETLAKQPQKALRHFADQSIEVHIPVTPVAGYEDLKLAYTDGLYDKDKFAQHGFNALGLPLEDIHVTYEAEDQLKEEQKNRKRELDIKEKQVMMKKTTDSGVPPKKKKKKPE